ncbi:MAG: ketoacyl-ACP synthase III [Bacteroidia bacterium]|nr:ketoacyl-ACP synthase III [Bacteroidia bacterium]
MRNAYIAGTGYYVPPKVVTNQDMMQWYDTTDEWITERSGIRERRWVEAGTGPSDLAIPAFNMALEDAGMEKDEIDFVIFATLSPEAWFPGSGCFFQEKMNLGTIGVLDIRQQCTGFVYGLSLAKLFVESGQYKNVALVAAEVQSTSIDLSNEGRTVGVLFGDGAGVVIVRAREDEPGILSTHLHADGRFAKELWVPEPSSTHYPKVTDVNNLHCYMNGREVFKHAVTRFPEVINEALDANGWNKDEVDLYIPHQANLRISQMVAKILGLPEEKFYHNIQKYGNTTAASIAIAMAEAQRDGSLKKGDKLVLAAFGAGFTWAGAAIIF